MATSNHLARTAAVGLVAVTAAAVASHLLAGRGRPRVAGEGRVLCPSEAGKSPAPTASLEAGDFVVVQLLSGDRAFMESTWAQVQSVSEDGIVVRLTGELGPTGVKPLQHKRHGFRLGKELLIGLDCAWDVFRTSTFDGQLLCGPQLAALDDFEEPNLRALGKGLVLEVGDRVEIVVASNEANGTAWWERLVVTVVTVSPTGQILSGVVDGDPQHTDLHHLQPGSFVQFNRDCVVKVY